MLDGPEPQDENWLYCVTTGKKLVPSFYKQLTDIFRLDSTKYTDVLDQICKERGQISDDGDKWVDKHSGFEIRKIDYDDEEGFDEAGFKMSTREVLDEDLESKILTSSLKEDLKVTTVEGKSILAVINYLSLSFGVSIPESHEFILNNTLKALHKIVGTKDDYEEKVKVAARKGKKMASYEKNMNQHLIFLTCLFYLVSIQTAIPSIVTKKTLPNCTKSFAGFPYEDNGNSSGMEYIACAIKKAGSSSLPWKAISKVKEASMVTFMKALYNKHLKNDSELRGMIIKKQSYIEEHGEDDVIPKDVSLDKWTTFQPFLGIHDVKLNDFKDINDVFEREFMENIKSGNLKIHKQVNLLKAKIMYASLHIQQEIQTIVEKEQLLLETKTGIPFLENSCCMEEKPNLPIEYFIKKQPRIATLIKKIMEYSELLDVFKNTNESTILFSNADTKLKYPPVNKDFSEKAIYSAFIKFCKFNKNLPLEDELLGLCIDNKSGFDLNDDLEKKMKILKEEGKQYSHSAFIKLLKLISKHNIIHFNLYGNSYSAKTKLEQLIAHFEESDSDVIQPNLIANLKQLTEKFDFTLKSSQDDFDKFMNYLITSNKALQTQQIAFLNENLNVSSREKKKLKKILDDIQNFKSLEGNYLTSGENNALRFSQFMKQQILNISKIYPNIILNKVSYESIKLPSHWNLSQNHYKDIRTFVEKSHSDLKKLYGIDKLQPILLEIQDRIGDILLLMNQIPFIASIFRKEGGEKQEKKSLFNDELLKELYLHFFYLVIEQYIQMQDLDIPSIMQERGGSAVGNITSIATMDDVANVEFIESEKATLRENIAKLLHIYMVSLNNNKTIVNYNEETIKQRILSLKTTEKDRTTKSLKDKTDEERNVDNLFKSMKLGRWSKGLQKGLTQYVRETYDEERNELEREAILELQVGKTTEASAMNMEIYKFENAMQQQADLEAEREAYNMSDIVDDDDYDEERDGLVMTHSE